VSTFARTTADQAGLTDAATVALTQERTFTDQTGLTDQTTVERIKLVTQTDQTGITDATTVEFISGIAAIPMRVAMDNPATARGAAGSSTSSHTHGTSRPSSRGTGGTSQPDQQVGGGPGTSRGAVT